MSDGDRRPPGGGRGALDENAIVSSGNGCASSGESTVPWPNVRAVLSLERDEMVGSASRSSFLFEHDLFGKPVSPFPDHALGHKARQVAQFRVGDGEHLEQLAHAFRAG